MLLAQPGAIGALRLKNRVVMAPMAPNYSTTDGLSTERDKQYYAERARGGVAMIMTERWSSPRRRAASQFAVLLSRPLYPGL